MKSLVLSRRIVVTRSFSQLRGFVCSLPDLFTNNESGRVIYSGRNELREFSTQQGLIVVKSFCIPNLLNRIAYGFLRKSKAQRSCEYAAMLRSRGFGSPAPVGWCSVRRGLLFSESYYACLRSELPYTYKDILEGTVQQPEKYYREIGRFAAKMHNEGMIHRDFSRGNILLGLDDAGMVRIQIIDLNRIRFHRVSLHEGLQNFYRLPASPEMRRLMLMSYCEARGCTKDDAARESEKYVSDCESC